MDLFRWFRRHRRTLPTEVQRETLIQGLAHADADVRRASARQLEEWEPSAEVTRVLMKELRATDAAVRGSAMRYLRDRATFYNRTDAESAANEAAELASTERDASAADALRAIASRAASAAPAAVAGQLVPLRGTEQSESFAIPAATEPISLQASPNARRAGYIVNVFPEARVEVNGRALAPGHYVWSVTVGNEAVAYVLSRGNRLHACFNGDVGEGWESIGKSSPFLSPDSRRLAYTGYRNGAWYAIVDGVVRGGPCEGFGPGGILFSPDSRRFAWTIKRRDAWLAVVDGVEQEPHDGIVENGLAFSPDGETFAYFAVNGAEVALIVNGRVQRVWSYDPSAETGVHREIYFSPDSRRLAYLAKRRSRTLVVIDGDVVSDVEEVLSGWGHPLVVRAPGYGKLGWKRGAISFSPDSRRYAFAGEIGDGAAVFLDGREIARYKAVTGRPICFSPDSRRLAWGIEEEWAQRIVVDGETLPACRGLAFVNGSFSPDSRRFAYAIATDVYAQHALAVDDAAYPVGGAFLTGTSILWDSPDRLHSLVVRGHRGVLFDFTLH